MGKYVGELIEIAETRDIIYIGNKFPDEYGGSSYTRKTKGARAKAKANAAQGIREMVEIATDKVYRENHKEKHSEDAHNGWFYYVTRFAIPLYNNEKKTGEYMVLCQDLVQVKMRNFSPILTCQKLSLSVRSFIHSFEFVWRHIVAMAMTSFRIVESFQIFKNQLVCLLIVANFKAVEPFTFDNRMKGFNACIVPRKSFLRITALHIFGCFFIFLCNILAATIRMDN